MYYSLLISLAMLLGAWLLTVRMVLRAAQQGILKITLPQGRKTPPAGALVLGGKPFYPLPADNWSSR
jgi:hypothetical protein